MPFGKPIILVDRYKLPPTKLKQIAQRKVRGVYGLFDAENGRVYIGASGNIIQRWQSHLATMEYGNHRVFALQEDWKVHEFSFVVLQKSRRGVAGLLDLEEEWKAKFPLCYNVATHRVGFPGGQQSVASRAQISANRWGSTKPVGRPTGWHHTLETCAKMSVQNIGKHLSPETKGRIAARLRGRFVSQETREKRAVSLRRCWQDPKYRAQVLESNVKARRTVKCQRNLSNAALKLWQDPSFRAKVSAAMKAGWQKRKERLCQNQ